MTQAQGMRALWFMSVLTLSAAWLGLAGERFTTSIYEGQIKSIRIEKCGLEPGLCDGSIILSHPGGGDMTVDIRVGTWIKRGDTFLTIEDLKIGDQVKAQTFHFPDETNQRAAILEFSKP